MTYRALTENEIRVLETQGNYASDWQRVFVTDPFEPEWICNTRFLGEVKLGVTKPKDENKQRRGLYNSCIQDCILGNDVLIENVGFLSDYEIGDRTILRNTQSIFMDGTSTFGNGVEAEVLNEGGGRTIQLFDRLSSQLAYMLLMFRHDLEFIEKINDQIDAYVHEKIRERGGIGSDCLIQDCATLCNMYIYPHAQIEGAQFLKNGTVVSEERAVTRIGAGVYAQDFIVQSGSKLDSHAIVVQCFVGQSVKIEKQFSAENSIFFANSEMMHGEACSIFAGPYTVSHHKSTLLIASMFSFYNAGSGTNQSNHMYKLGPVHQGILERGSKTGSFSYMLWPSRIGPYSVVIGKHYSNFDTAHLPFSYINEIEEKSVLTPAMNLFTVGTLRDSQKWPQRDKRTGSEKLDFIHFDLWNPYITQKLMDGSKTLEALIEKSDKKHEFVKYNGLSIKRLMLKTCKKYYELAIGIALGEWLIKKIEALSQAQDITQVKQQLVSSEKESFLWLDVGGWVVPSQRIQTLIQAVRSGKINTLEKMREEMDSLYHSYEEDAWRWCCGRLCELKGKNLREFNQQDWMNIINEWKSNKIKLNHMILKDAEKEFAANARIGYGVEGIPDSQEADFENVRGSVETNSFIQDLRKENEKIEEAAQRYCEWIKAVW